MSDMPFQKFCHQAVHGASGGTHYLQNFRAITFFVESPYQGLDLPLNALRSENQISLLFDCVAHI